MRKRNKYQVSANKMYRLKVKLTARLKNTPEDDISRRERLIRKIELLNVCRQEMRELINSDFD